MIDAIVITGILILLTISPPETNQGFINFTLTAYVKITILITLLPFTISAIIEIRDSIKNEETRATKKGLRFMQYGFAYLILLVALITIGQLYPIFANLP